MSSVLASLLALAVAAPPPVRYVWRNVAVVAGGFVTGVITHPKAKDVVYARTDIGGAYRWDPAKNRWNPLQDWLTRDDWNLYGTEGVAIDPNDPKRVYMAVGTYTNQWGTNGAILRSANGGKSWARTDLPFKNGGNEDGRSIGERLAVNPQNGRDIYFGTRNNGLWHSTDRGLTWRQESSFPILGRTDHVGVGWVLFGKNAIFVGAQTIYKSVDKGKTWQPLPGQPTGMRAHHAETGPGDSLYLTYSNGPGPNGITDGAVWKTDGTSWTDITPLKPGGEDRFGYAGLSLDRSKPGTLIVSTLDRWGKDTIFRSTNDGKSWVSLAQTAVNDASRSPYLTWGRSKAEFGHWIGDCEVDPQNSNHAWYVTGATIWTTNDLTNADKGEPTHWVVGAEGIEETAVLDLLSPPVGANVVSALGDIGGFTHFDLSKPADGIWTGPILSSVTDIDFAEGTPDVFVKVGSTYDGTQHGGISVDGARSWTAFPTDAVPGRSAGSIAISADGTTILWAPDMSAPMKTTDRGHSWVGARGSQGHGRVISDRVDSSTFYVHDREGGTVYVSHDAGSTFALGSKLAVVEAGRLEAVPGKEGHLWLPTKTGLLRSTNEAKTFLPVAGVDSADAIGFGKAATGKDYPAIYLIGKVGGVTGAFRSIDEGGTWVQINDKSTGYGTMQVITGDPKLFGRVYVGTNGRGVLYADPIH